MQKNREFDSITILQVISPRVRRENIDWGKWNEAFISLLSEILNLSALVLDTVNSGELKSFSLNNYNKKGQHIDRIESPMTNCVYSVQLDVIYKSKLF